MLKSKWIQIPVKILLILLFITIYFYFQHPVIYRYTGFNASIPIGEEQLIIDEISIHNIDNDKSLFYQMNGKIPWQYRLLEKMNPPARWRSNFYRVIAFYSRPSLTKDYGTMQVYGTYIFPRPISDTDNECLSDRYDISIFPTGGSSGNGWTRDFFKNALAVSSRSKFPFKAMDKPFLLTVNDKVNEKSTQLLITPQWQKERILRRESGKNPAFAVEKYIGGIYQNKPQSAADYTGLASKNITMEGNLKWLDVFEDYYGVYQVEAEVNESTEEGAKSSLPPEKITLYMHKDNDGKYKVIYCQMNSDKTKS